MSTGGWVAAGALAVVMLFKYDKKTTDVSGAAFVAVAVLAGLAFTHAGVMDDEGPDRSQVVYAGERLSYGAILFLVASLLKYGTLAIPDLFAWIDSLGLPDAQPTPGIPPDYLDVKLVQFSLWAIFANGLLYSQRGYVVFGQVLLRRAEHARQNKPRQSPPRCPR